MIIDADAFSNEHLKQSTIKELLNERVSVDYSPFHTFKQVIAYLQHLNVDVRTLTKDDIIDLFDNDIKFKEVF